LRRLKTSEAKGVTFRETDRAYFAQAVQPVWKAFLDKYPDLKPMMEEFSASGVER
jgi:TRAP-type C4-dicarboxylate transport system substrate-binding protein